MKNRKNTVLGLALVCAIGLYLLGSSSSEEQGTASIDSADPISAGAVQGGGQESLQAKPELITAQEQESPAAPEHDPLAFELPNPDRTKLFQAPKRQGRGRKDVAGQTETSVELLGFVNVDGQRVALSIDGLVATAAVGEQPYGIEVISIQPPLVVLKRAKQRSGSWVLSTEF